MSKQKSVDKRPTSLLVRLKNKTVECFESILGKNLSTRGFCEKNIKEILKHAKKVIKVVAALPFILIIPAMQFLGLASLLSSSLKGTTFSRIQVKHRKSDKKTKEFHRQLYCFLISAILLTCLNCVSYADNLNQYLYQQSAIAHQVSSSASKETSALEAIKAEQIRQYANFTQSLRQNRTNTYQKYQGSLPDSIVFVSFSMPESLIVQVLRDAKAHHMPVVIRGLIDNSFAKTTATLFDLAKKYKGIGGVQIAPQYFKTFGITEVPAVLSIVNHDSCTADHCPNDHFFVVYGNEHIEQALSQIDRAKRLRGL